MLIQIKYLLNFDPRVSIFFHLLNCYLSFIRVQLLFSNIHRNSKLCEYVTMAGSELRVTFLTQVHNPRTHLQASI